MEDTAMIKTGTSWNSYIIKLFAITAMLIDHIAWAFVPTLSPLGQVMHIIGRITAPVMCYFIAEGYYHTRSVKKYALRLFVFAAISYIPFVLFETKKLPTWQTFTTFNVIYTLFCGLLALWAWDKMKNKDLSIMAIFGLCILASPGDWGIFGVLYVLVFGVNHGNIRMQVKWFCIISLIMAVLASLPFIIMNIPVLAPAVLQMMHRTGKTAIPPAYSQLFQFGVFLAVPLLLNYNGERGGGKYSKWIFYVFYPVHLLILALLKLFVFK